MRSPRFYVLLGVVVLVVGLGGAGFLWADNRADQTVSHGWEECEAPRVAEVPSWGGFEITNWEGPRLGLELVGEVKGATAAAQTIDGSFLVTIRDGRLMRAADGEVTEILDLREEVLSEEPEQGMTDVVVDPSRTSLYLSLTDLTGALEVRAYTIDSAGLPIADPRLVIRVPQPHEWQQGGDLEIGPDGMLYLSLGDGGHIGDPDQNGQDPGTLLATIIRIDPTRQGYEVPAGNPFRSGWLSVGAPEVVAYGFRNPWRFSFDRATGNMWVGDVGQNCVEEVDVIPAGEWGLNFGWSRLEGSYRFQGDLPASHVLPVFEYLHPDGGCAVTGGYVYRGEMIPELFGAYVFADYCRGRLHALVLDGTEVVGLVDLGVRQRLLPSFVEDADGELYVVSSESGLLRLVADG